jgi:hypothetical protein
MSRRFKRFRADSCANRRLSRAQSAPLEHFSTNVLQIAGRFSAQAELRAGAGCFLQPPLACAGARGVREQVAGGGCAFRVGLGGLFNALCLVTTLGTRRSLSTRSRHSR